MKTNQTPKDIDEYIAGFPIDVQEIIENIGCLCCIGRTRLSGSVHAACC